MMVFSPQKRVRAFFLRVQAFWRSAWPNPSPSVPSERFLRLMSLEDRRVLNASLTLAAGNEGIDLTGGESLTMQDGGMQDVGSGAVQTADLVLGTGTWSLDEELDENLYDLSADSKTLTIDHAALSDGGAILSAGDVLQIRGDDATTDTVTLDLTNLDFVPSGGIDLTAGEDPGNGDNDSLTVTGYSLAGSLTVNHTGSEAGNLVFDGLGTITFSEIEPLALTGTAADLIINLPAGVDNIVVLSDDGTAGDGISQIDGTFELTTFANPTNSLTINDGTGVKTISVQGMDSLFSADLTIQEDDATDDNAVTLETNATDTNGGNLSVDADTITVNASVTTDGGNVNFNAVSTVSSTVTGSITTTSAANSGTASGSVEIDAGTAVNLSGVIDTSGADHSVAAATASTGGQVDIDTLDGPVTVAGIDTSGGDATGGGASTGGDGASINITAADTGDDNTHDVTLNAVITAVGGNGATNGTGMDVKITSDNNLAINNVIVLGAGNLFLDVTGNVTQTAAVSGAGLALMVDGTTTLNNAANDFTTFAADNGGETQYTDADTLSVDSVTVDAMTVTGITTSDDDVNLTVDANDLSIDAVISTLGGQVGIDALTGSVNVNQGVNSGGGNVDVTATAGSVNTAADGDITTTSGTVDGASGNLDIDAGTDVTLAGDISTTGGATNGDGGDVTIDTVAGDVTVGVIEASGSGSGASGLIDINANGANSDLIVNDDLTTSGGDMTLTADDAIAFAAAANVVSDGGNVLVRANDDAAAGDGIAVPATAANSINMIDGSSINSGTGTVTLRTDGASGGSITSESITTANGIVTVNAETSVSINGPVVSGGALVDIDAGTEVSSSADGDITTTGDQANEDSGEVTIHSNVTGNISLDGDVITRGFDNNSGTDSSDGGNVTVMTVDGTVSVTNIDSSGGNAGATAANAGGNAGNIALDANSAATPRVILNGDLTAAGGNNVNALPDPGTRGNGTNIVISDPARLGSDVKITTFGNNSGDVTFTATVEGTTDRLENLVILAGTADAPATTTYGDVTFTGAVGTGAIRLGDISIDTAKDVLVTSTVDAASFTQLAGSGNTTIDGVVTASSGGPTTIHTFDGNAAVNPGTDQITITGHNYVTGDNVVYDDGAGGADSATNLDPEVNTIPGLEAGRTYVVIVDNANTIRLALNHEHAEAGTAIDLSAAGQGTQHSIAKTAVSVSVSGIFDVNADINAEDGTGDNTALTGEQIIISAGTVDIAPNVDVSTASVIPAGTNLTYTPTGDRIRINAENTLNFGASSRLITEAGIANTFEPGLPLAAIPQDQQNSTAFDQDQLFSTWKVDVGAADEVNLQVHIDWRDPSNNAVVNPPPPADAFNNPTSDRYETFSVGAGGQTIEIGHFYSNLFDFTPFALSSQVTFVADFSVSHHDSIRVVAPNVVQNPSTDNVQNSTDDPNTGSFNPLADDHLAPANANFTGIGSTDEVTDNQDLHFENGLLQVVMSTTPLFVMEERPDPPAPVPAPAPAVPVLPPEPLHVLGVETLEPPLEPYSTQSEDFFQLRRTGSTDPIHGYEHIDNEVGWKLLQPKELKGWVQDQDLNGAGFELWLITTKTRNGDDVTFERPVLKFDVVDQQAFPVEETIPEQWPELQLEKLSVDEDGYVLPEDSGQPVIQKNRAANGSDTTGEAVESPQNAPQPEGAAAAEQSSDDQTEEVPEDGNEVSRLESGDVLVRSAMAGLTVSALLSRRKKTGRVSRHLTTVARILSQQANRK